MATTFVTPRDGTIFIQLKPSWPKFSHWLIEIQPADPADGMEFYLTKGWSDTAAWFAADADLRQPRIARSHVATTYAPPMQSGVFEPAVALVQATVGTLSADARFFGASPASGVWDEHLGLQAKRA